MKRLVTALAILGAVLANAAVAAPFVAGTAHAAAGTTVPFQSRIGRFLGIVPTPNEALTQPAKSGSGGPLEYQGGPVMTTNKVYTIYWIPQGYSVSDGFVGLINRYFSDLQADNGKNGNVYDVATQYFQGSDTQTQYIQTNTTFKGSAVATDPLPPMDPINCPGAAAGAQSGVDTSNPANMAPGTNAWCVTDGQIQQEISNVIKANHWTAYNNTEFFIFPASHIATCFSPPVGVGAGPVGTTVSAPLCSSDYYCAYHSWYFDSTVNPNSQIIYANMGYSGDMQGEPFTCNQGQAPNGDLAADAEMTVISHEHIESLTDPFGTGWYDSSGSEIGDICNGDYGDTFGPSGAAYNQTINGHHYVLQMEYSNADYAIPSNAGNGCVNWESPQISLTPSVGYPTAPFKVTGQFFGANENVPVTFTSEGSTRTELRGAVRSDASGHLAKLSTTVPRDALPGNATVTATGQSSHTSGTAPFTVPSD